MHLLQQQNINKKIYFIFILGAHVCKFIFVFLHVNTYIYRYRYIFRAKIDFFYFLFKNIFSLSNKCSEKFFKYICSYT